VIPGHSGSGQSHFAFAIAAGKVEAWRQHLERLQVPIESVVTWPRGAKSICFRDPDRHVVELLTPGSWAID
jgi:catechol 2,3-dioxygenase-like lactoylglutathione lyase family enzyme